MKSYIKYLNEAVTEVPHDVEETDHSVESILTRETNKRKYGRTPSGEKIKVIGKGMFGKVYDEGDPHSVTKVAKSYDSNPHNDPYVNYVSQVNHYDNESHENPHFPRVHSIQSISGHDGTVHIVKMERLHPIKDLSPEERDAMWHHAMGEQDKAKKHTASGKKLASLAERPPEEAEHLAATRSVVDNFLGGMHTKDDYHSGNVMARRTPTGPQLVVTDPLFSTKDLRKEREHRDRKRKNKFDW